MTAENCIPLHDLREITNGFSVDSRIGQGGYGDVYKGVYNGREVAVKLLHVDTVQGIDDQQYINEVSNLSRAKHPNIIQLLGYSYETTSELVEHNSKRRLSQHIYRALCFEYFQGGSLDVRLREKSLAPDWSTRYNIIKGISEGLNFLHGCKPAIFHLDLKPANILLDNAMVPKVADFGLSRVISQSHTQVTKQIRGTQAYMPPEFINGGNISHKNDVFSLGLVMIEIMTGSSGYYSYIEMDEVVQFKQKVHTDWKNRIKDTSEYPLEELHQVQTCIDTAMRCLEPDRNNRPTIAEVIDILNKTETHIPKRQMSALPCPTIVPKSTESNMLEMMIAELENITNEHERCNSMPRDSLNNNVQQEPDRETTSDVEEALIIGRTEEKQKILSILSENITEETVILPIFGMGGIGKTTLAQLVFNDPMFQDYCQVWVHVSETLNLNKIGNSVISQLTDEISQIANKQMLHNRLRKLFTGKSILIVLDDLWEENPDKLNDLMTMLKLGTQRKVIVIVTTRDEAIAKIICGPAITPYKLEILTDDMCWTIIKQKASFKDRVDKKQLEHIGMEIAIKCGGVALAAHSLGYMLRGMTSDQWESVRDNCIWNLSTRKDPSLRIHKVLASLLLSYSHMPNWLKLCFSYCAVFPKGHIIVKCDLIHQWIALGFTEQSNMFDSMQLCEKYVTQLLGMSFLQYLKTKPSNVRRQHDGGTLFMMHDLVHDLAKEILSHQINAGGNRCRYALLTDCSSSLQLFVAFPANIRALHFRECGKQELCGGAFSPAKCLRVLDLSECSIPELPDCIGQLKQLRFLCAPRTQDQMIPDCITELSELNYLNLSCSRNISALPESIGDMKALMHLDLSVCHKIRELPKSFVELKQLVHLDLSSCCVSISEGFGGFTKLQYLNLSCPFIKHANRRGLSKVMGNLIKLEYLNLSGSIYWMASTEYEIGSLLCSISTLSNLKHLDLSWNREISCIPESIGNLRKLHTLDLLWCSHLKKLPDSMVNMVSLKVLIVDKGVTLDESVLCVLNIPLLPHFVVHVSSDQCTSNINLLRPTNPDKLTIDRLENVKSVEEALSIKLIEKQKIEELKFQWTVAIERFVDDKEVLEKLVPPSSVEILDISGYMSVSIPGWLMDIRQYLPNLKTISLFLPKCKNLPPLGRLPNLQNIHLCHMDSLEEWSTADTSGEEGVNELMFPKLEQLMIKQCAKLKIKPYPPRAMYVWIQDCDNMLSSWGESSSHNGASSSSEVTQLSVEDSKVPLHWWKLLHRLPALRVLAIKNCSDLTTSPEIIKCLCSLETLSLWAPNLRSLPDWLGDSIQQLTKLKYLTIRGGTALRNSCESEENKMKFAHIGAMKFVADEADDSSS